MRNPPVAIPCTLRTMTNESPTTTRPVVERSVELDLDVTDALEAVLRPEILSVWLGRWTPGDDDAHATVVTDDGIRRRVDDIARHIDGVSWRWSPDTAHETDDGAAPDITSDVRITVVPLAGDRSRLTVTEVQASSGAVLDGLAWSICLLALEIAAAARALASV